VCVRCLGVWCVCVRARTERVSVLVWACVRRTHNAEREKVQQRRVLLPARHGGAIVRPDSCKRSSRAPAHQHTRHRGSTRTCRMMCLAPGCSRGPLLTSASRRSLLKLVTISGTVRLSAMDRGTPTCAQREQESKARVAWVTAMGESCQGCRTHSRRHTLCAAASSRCRGAQAAALLCTPNAASGADRRCRRRCQRAQRRGRRLRGRTWSMPRLGSAVMTVRAEKSTRLPMRLPRMRPSLPLSRCRIVLSGLPDRCVSCGWPACGSYKVVNTGVRASAAASEPRCAAISGCRAAQHALDATIKGLKLVNHNTQPLN
jgi:hypothetical protein